MRPNTLYLFRSITNNCLKNITELKYAEIQMTINEVTQTETLLHEHHLNIILDLLVQKQLLSSPAFQNSQRISVYLSTQTEVDTEPIVRKIFELNKQCYIPRYNKSVMEMVKLKDMNDWETLPLTKWHIKQPNLTDERQNVLDAGGLDLVILPGVAFAKDGKRLGHGKGYYDKYLHAVFKLQTKPPTTIAMAFKEQIVDDVPTHEHDVILDMVLYPE